MRRGPRSSFLRRCPAARAASTATRRSSDAMRPQCIIRTMHIVVMGAGSVGGYFGAKLLRAGEKVTMVARGPHLEAIRRTGLTIRSAVDGESVVRPAAVERLEGVERADAVLFCVKSFDTDDAAARLWSILGSDTPVLSLQNGVDNEERIDAQLGAGRAIGGVAQVFATIEAPGVIRHHAAGRIIFGELDGRVSERAERLRDAFARAEVPAEVSKDVRRALWEKYILICAVAGTTAVTRETIGVIRETPATWRLFRTLVEEATALAGASGVDLPGDTVDQILKFAQTIAPGNRGSASASACRPPPPSPSMRRSRRTRRGGAADLARAGDLALRLALPDPLRH